MKSFVVIGLGRFGTEAALQLSAAGCEVLALDNSSELILCSNWKLNRMTICT